MIEENGRSRVFLGVHWLFDAFATDDAGKMDLTQNVGGVRLGLDIANDIATNGLHANKAAGSAPA
jgi:vanadium chloroperoxidase